MDKLQISSSLCSAKPVDENGSFLLEETSKNATLRKIHLLGIPKDSIIVKMDKIRFHNFLKDNSSWGFNKHSDYMVITDDKLVILELKSNKEVNKDLILQCQQKFLADTCILKLSDDIFVSMLKKNAFFTTKQIHYVLLYQKLSTSLFPSIFEKDENTDPLKFRKIAVLNESSINFNRLI